MKKQLFPLLMVLFAILLAACTPQSMQKVTLYYYDPELDQDATGNVLCSQTGLVPVQRELPVSLESNALIEEAISMLILGELTAEERVQDITTEFPLEGVELLDVSLAGGVLTLTFADPNFRTSGGACRVGVLWAQIEATALQFDGVEQVRFQPEELFQP